MIAIAREYADLGFGIIRTSGTAEMLAAAGVEVTKVFKIAEGRPNVRDLVKNGQIQFIINTPSGKTRARTKSNPNAALTERIRYDHNSRGRAPARRAFARSKRALTVRSLQEYHAAGSQASSLLGRRLPAGRLAPRAGWKPARRVSQQADFRPSARSGADAPRKRMRC